MEAYQPQPSHSNCQIRKSSAQTSAGKGGEARNPLSASDAPLRNPPKSLSRRYRLGATLSVIGH